MPLNSKELQDLLDELEASRASRKRAWENLQEIRWVLKDVAGMDLLRRHINPINTFPEARQAEWWWIEFLQPSPQFHNVDEQCLNGRILKRPIQVEHGGIGPRAT